MNNILSMDFFTGAIENALKDGAEKPAAIPQTNVLNAEYALGKYHAIIDIMSEIYDYKVIAGIHDTYKGTVEGLMKRANSIY
jgi:hypothetical protein